MFRQPGSNMTAVEIVSCRYDGPIPADVMMEARAEDARFAANPNAFKVNAALENLAWNTRCARESIARIQAFEAAGQTLSAISERKQILPVHLKARRQYQAEARQFRCNPSVAKPLGYGFPSHAEMLGEFAAGMREHNARAA